MAQPPAPPSLPAPAAAHSGVLPVAFSAQDAACLGVAHREQHAVDYGGARSCGGNPAVAVAVAAEAAAAGRAASRPRPAG